MAAIQNLYKGVFWLFAVELKFILLTIKRIYTMHYLIDLDVYLVAENFKYAKCKKVYHMSWIKYNKSILNHPLKLYNTISILYIRWRSLINDIIKSFKIKMTFFVYLGIKCEKTICNWGNSNRPQQKQIFLLFGCWYVMGEK